MPLDVVAALRDAGIQPSAQRVAVARYVLGTGDHPSAEQVWARVRGDCPVLSRPTVYNTLNLLVEKGLVRRHVLAQGRVVFDPNVARHHHLIDQAGRIHDIPWDAVRVSRVEAIDGFDVQEYQVVMHGRRLARGRPRPR
jgi:Fe2+ or Zn2+ uptake regulation protein